jgi:hypothetical protein
LSINVEVDLAESTLLGKKIVGRRPLVVTDSKKVSDSIFLPTLSRLQLKSRRTIAFLWGRLIN